MFEEELRDFTTFLEENNFSSDGDIKEIINIVYLAMFESITKNIYEYYEPKTYTRHFQLLKSIDYSVINGLLFMYIDTSKLDYSSAVTGEDVSDYVPLFVGNGHNDSSHITNQYHHYEARNFLEGAKEIVERKLDMKVEIIIS